MFSGRKGFARLLGVEAVLFALAFVVGTGVIPDWGRWYSPTLHYRRQTDAFFHAELALSHRPVDVDHDLTWSCGGVHQVWGLGVPAWRFPFEVLARLCGQAAFPDRIAFAVAVALWAWFVLRTLLPDPGEKSGERPWSFGAGVVASLMVLANPCFVSLCSVRFAVYEEAVAYEYLFGTAVLLGLLRLTLRPSYRGWCWLVFLAGFGPLVRPPLVFHGFAALLLGGWICRKALAAGRWWKVALPVGLWCVGGGLLYWTNLVRFGSGFEFGHRLNLQTLFGSMYATRFDDPYASEPLIPALREMWGMLFGMDQLNGGDFYAANFFGGQSGTLRWREFYFSTYDVSWIAVWMAGLAAWIWRRKAKVPTPDVESIQRSTALDGADACPVGGPGLQPVGRDPQPGVRSSLHSAECPDRLLATRLAPMAGWGLSTSLVLVAFYLRNCVVSSRYMADFAPAFAGFLVCATLLLLSRLEQAGRRAWNLGALALLGWLVWQISTGRNTYGPPAAFSGETLRERLQSRLPDSTPLPSEYRLPVQEDPPSANAGSLPGIYDGLHGLRYNGVGWNPRSGETKPLVLFFVEDVRFLEMDLSPAEGRTLSEGDWGWVRVKIGLETLRLESSASLPEGGRRLRFSGPTTPGYSHGTQVIYLALGRPEDLDAPASPFRLHSIRWRRVGPDASTRATK